MNRFVLSALMIAVLWFPTSVIQAEQGCGLRVGTFRCDVTPPLGLRLYSKPLVKVEHPLLAKGIVLEEGRQRYVLCAVDWCILIGKDHLLFRTAIADAAEVDVSRVAVQTLHQHTAPTRIRDPKFGEELKNRLAVAVKEAVSRLQPIDTVGVGQAKVQRVAATRRVLTKDGKIRVRWSACKDPSLRAMPEGLIDPMLKTITLFRGKKALVRLHYYATHPQTYYKEGRASYDFVGMAREELEQEEKVFQIYFSGCSGDVTVGKYNEGTPEHRAQLAERLLAGMKASISSTRPVPIDGLQWRTIPVVFTSKNGAKMDPIYLSSLKLGNAHILNLPGEPMVEFQLFAQRVLPKAFVAVAGTGDWATGYICTERAFEEGGYEPTASRVAPQSEKTLKKAIGQLLGVESASGTR